MKVLILGDKGQLGYELKRTRPPGAEVTGCDLPEVNVVDASHVQRVVGDVLPEVIINAAAYTAVDQAEEERDAAFAVNAAAVEIVAAAAKSRDARLIHVSTDFIFDGKKGSPYLPQDAPNPLGVYGASKAEGERVLLRDYPEKSCIVRTAWLYSAHGRNFVKTMLNLYESRDAVQVVCDQIGSPTWAFHLASFIWRLVEAGSFHAGVLHYTDAGVASWYDLAVAVEEESRKWRGRMVTIDPIYTDEYPTKAVRPPCSVLEKRFPGGLGSFPFVHWREALRRMLEEHYSK